MDYGNNEYCEPRRRREAFWRAITLYDDTKARPIYWACGHWLAGGTRHDRLLAASFSQTGKKRRVASRARGTEGWGGWFKTFFLIPYVLYPASTKNRVRALSLRPGRPRRNRCRAECWRLRLLHARYRTGHMGREATPRAGGLCFSGFFLFLCPVGRSGDERCTMHEFD